MQPNFFSKSLFIFVIVFGICTILNFLFSVLVFDRVGIALLPGGLIALASAVYFLFARSPPLYRRVGDPYL